MRRQRSHGGIEVGRAWFYLVIRRDSNQDIKSIATSAPLNCAKIKAGVSLGRIPTNVSLSERARVTAGFAKDVDAVNQ